MENVVRLALSEHSLPVCAAEGKEGVSRGDGWGGDFLFFNASFGIEGVLSEKYVTSGEGLPPGLPNCQH